MLNLFLLSIPTAYASRFDELVQARNLVSVDQLIESTPPPTVEQGFAEDKEGAEFLNTHLGRILNEAGNIGLDASVVKPAGDLALQGPAQDPSLIIQQLLALTKNAAAASPSLKSQEDSPDTSQATSSPSQIPLAASVPSLSPIGGVPSLVVPSLAPIEIPSAASAYNQAVEKIQEAAEKWKLPSINAFNATLPEIDSIGSGAGLPDVMELVGQNLGSSMGASAGNLAAGTTNLVATYAKSLKDGFVSVLGNFGGASRRRLDDDDDHDDDDRHEKKKEKAEKGQKRDQGKEGLSNDMIGQNEQSDSTSSLYDTPSIPYDPELYYGGFFMPPINYPPPSVVFPAPYQQQQNYGWNDNALEWGGYTGGLNFPSQSEYMAGDGLYGDNSYAMGTGTEGMWEHARRLLSAADHLRDGHALLGNRRQLLSSMTPFAFSLSDLQDSARLQSALNATLPHSLLSSLSLTDYLFNNPFFTPQATSPILNTQASSDSTNALTQSLQSLSNSFASSSAASNPVSSLLTNPLTSLSPSLLSLSPSLASLSPSSASLSPSITSPQTASESIPSVPVASEALGSGVGDVLGSTLGGLVGGFTSLVGTTASSATAGFLQGSLPVNGPWLASLNKTATPSRRLLSAKARILEADEKSLREGVSCAVSGSAFSSGRLMTFTNIESLRVCQLICQTYSDPLVIYNCSETSSLGDICLAVSFSQISGRCDLHFALDGEYEIEGFDSAPVVCPDTTFVQPANQIETILNADPNASSCLEGQAVSIQRVQESAKPLPVTLAAAPSLPSLPEFLNENAAKESIWRYNPDTPNITEFRVDLIYQVQQVSQPPPAGKAFWGSITEVADWRHCALYCVLDADCRFWTYLFDPLTYNETLAGCRLATNSEPSARTLAGGPRAISGPRLTYLPLELFGPSLNQTTKRRLVADPKTQQWRAHSQPPARLEETPLLPSIVDKRLLMSLTGRQLQETSVPSKSGVARIPCSEFGFVYHSTYSSLTRAKTIPTNLFSLTALTAEKCLEACERTSGCKGFQLVPVATLAASTRLQGSQRSSCLLLSEIAHKVPADPMIISGVVPTSEDRLCSSNDLPLSTAVIGHSLDDLAEAVTGPLDTSDRGNEEEDESEATVATSESETACITAEGYGRQFDKDISYRGKLISDQANVISGVKNPSECWRECANVESCQAFSWGPWKGCYLLATVENMMVADAGLVSGYKECDLNQNAQEYETLKRRLQALGGQRDVSTCGRAVRGRVYDQGALISNLTDQKLTENECFHKCRETEDCYYITYYNTQQAQRRLQLFNKPKSVQPLRRLQEVPDMLPEAASSLPDSSSTDGLTPNDSAANSLEGASLVTPQAAENGSSIPDADASSDHGMQTPVELDAGSLSPTDVPEGLDPPQNQGTPDNSETPVNSDTPVNSETPELLVPVSAPLNETGGFHVTAPDPSEGQAGGALESGSPLGVTADSGVESGSAQPDGETVVLPQESTCLLFERVGQMINVQAGLGVSAEVHCDVLGDLAFEEPQGRHQGGRQMMLPTLVVVASGGLIFVAAALYIGVRERRRHQKASLIRNLEISSPGSSLTPSSFGHMNFNAFGMKSPLRATGSPDRLERGSPAAKVLDFEAVEPKSTGKRLKKTF